jgi:hypothetical protein
MANTSYIGVGPADRDPTVSDNSVTEGKIANDAVTNTKIADNAVDGAQIALTGNVQGAVMYYNGTDWVVLTPGTSGEALKTQGAGQNVVWGAVSSTGDFANGGDTATANRTLGNNDNFAMGFETNAINWLNINTDGIPQITGGLSANFDTAGVGTTLSSGIDASVTTIPELNVVPTPAVSKFADKPPVICGMPSVLIFNQLIALVSKPMAKLSLFPRVLLAVAVSPPLAKSPVEDTAPHTTFCPAP